MPLKTNRIPYPQNIKNFQVKTTAAKTTEEDVTNAVLAYTAPAAAPAVVTKLVAAPQATVTACRLKAYVAKAATPTVLRQVRNRLMPATTVNETTEQAQIDLGYTDQFPLKLQAGDLLYLAGGTANTITWHGEAEEYEDA